MAISDRVTARVDTAELENELSKTRSNLESWSAKQLAVAEGHKTELSDALFGYRAEVTRLKQEYQSLELAAEQVQQRLLSERDERTGTEKALAEVLSEKETLSKRLQQLEEALRAQEQEVLAKEKVLVEESKARAKRLQALDEALRWYQRHLGLRFEQSAGELTLVFTMVDVRDHDREFRIGIMIPAETDAYQVTECQPPLTGLPDLVSQLNENNDFAGFVKRVRDLFKRAADAG